MENGMTDLHGDAGLRHGKRRADIITPIVCADTQASRSDLSLDSPAG